MDEQQAPPDSDGKGPHAARTPAGSTAGEQDQGYELPPPPAARRAVGRNCRTVREALVAYPPGSRKTLPVVTVRSRHARHTPLVTVRSRHACHTPVVTVRSRHACHTPVGAAPVGTALIGAARVGFVRPVRSRPSSAPVSGASGRASVPGSASAPDPGSAAAAARFRPCPAPMPPGPPCRAH